MTIMFNTTNGRNYLITCTKNSNIQYILYLMDRTFSYTYLCSNASSKKIENKFYKDM